MTALCRGERSEVRRPPCLPCPASRAANARSRSPALATPCPPGNEAQTPALKGPWPTDPHVGLCFEKTRMHPPSPLSPEFTRTRSQGPQSHKSDEWTVLQTQEPCLSEPQNQTHRLQALDGHELGTVRGCLQAANPNFPITWRPPAPLSPRGSKPGRLLRGPARPGAKPTVS